MTPPPILVTGAGGCIGAWVLRQLISTGVPAVAFDLSPDRRRLALLFDAADVATADSVIWETGDIADSERLSAVFEQHRPAAVIHLAALQVPFCIADPLAGARVNVVGCVNVFEAAKRYGVKKVVYASSVAATAMADAAAWKQTLYGAYKVCNEHTARVYWHDAQITGIGIRPSVVYGPARDQGMSAAPTLAMLAAVLNIPYTIPFTGAVGFVYAREAAAAFVAAAMSATMTEGAPVFALNGIKKDISEVITMILARYPQAQISAAGAPLPFPSDGRDGALYEYVGGYTRLSFEDGMDETLAMFTRRVREGRISPSDLEDK